MNDYMEVNFTYYFALYCVSRGTEEVPCEQLPVESSYVRIRFLFLSLRTILQFGHLYIVRSFVGKRNISHTAILKNVIIHLELGPPNVLCNLRTM